MKIAIFIEQIFSTFTGEHRYLKNSLPELLRLGSEHEFTLFHSANYSSSQYPEWLTECADQARIVRLPYSRKRLFLEWIAGIESVDRWLGRQDIVENPSTLPISCKAGRIAVTIHDLAPAELP